MVKRSSHTRRSATSRKTSSRKSSSNLSRTRSLTARRQRRHSDGTFAKGFKAHATPKKSSFKTTSVKKRSITKTKASPKRKVSSYKPRVSKRLSGTASKKEYTPKMYAAERAFDFKCNSSTKEKVVKTVADNFTKEEIDKIDSQGKPVVTNVSNTEVKTDKDTYVRKRSDEPGKETEIVLKNNAGETTITHEVVHHLRTVDQERDKYAKTAYPVNKQGVMNADKIMKGAINDKRISNAEETATVAETELRTKNNSDYVSKYWKIDKNLTTGKGVRDSDRETMRKTDTGSISEGSNATGKKAIELVNRNYPKTMISSKKEGDETALSTFRKIINKRSKHQW